MRNLVIGFGTGRCGTKSLSGVLSSAGYDCTHEGVALSWFPSMSNIQFELMKFEARQSEMIGDVGFYWVHYLDDIKRRHPGAKIVNIYREDDEVVDSFMRRVEENGGADRYFFNGWYGYPFDDSRPTKSAIRRSVNRYRMLERLSSIKYGRGVYKIHVQELNDSKRVAALTEWLEA